jgi:hypothetical protein
VNQAEPRTPWRTRVIAFLVLAICAIILIKIVFAWISALGSVVLVVAAVLGVLWALSKL